MADIHSHRMVYLKLPQGVQPAAWALCRHSKDIYNTIVELIRQAASVCEWDSNAQVYRRKPAHCLSQREADAMAIWDGQLARLNARWTTTYKTKKELWDATGEGEKPKDLTLPTLGTVLAEDDLWKVLLNSSLLLAVAKATPDAMLPQINNKVQAAFRTLPAKMAEASVFLARDNFSSWLLQLAAWKQNKKAVVQPQMPNYLPRDAALVCSTSGAAVGKHLSSLKKCLLWLDADHFKPLSRADREAYAAFPIRKVAEAAIAARWSAGKKPEGLARPAWEDLATVVLIPKADGQVSLRISVKVEINYPEHSFLSIVARNFPSEWAAADTLEKRDLFVAKMIKEQNWRPSGALADAPFAKNKLWIGDRFCACGIDLGLRNIITMAWTHGEDADVFDAAALDKALDVFERNADRWISLHMTDEHRLLENEKLAWLQAQSTKPENLRDKFPLKSAKRLQQLSEQLHNRKPLLKMRAKRARWLRDKLHQISAKIVKLAIQRGAAVVVVGKNDGWKSGINLGRKENKRFVRLSHAELIKLIGQKLAAAGIAMILTEESYTSEASFIDHDPLREPRALMAEPDVRRRSGWGMTAAEALAAKNEQKEKEEKANALAAGAAGVFVDRHGKRDKKNQDRFVRHTPWASRKPGQSDKPVHGPAVIHADVNGAFNILRKVCPDFKWHPGLSVSHTVWWMSWRDGLSKKETMVR